MPRCLLIVLLLLCGPAWAFEAARLEQPDVYLNLSPHLGYLEDVDGQLQPDEVAQLPDEQFSAVTGIHANMGKNQSTWWFRLKLDNRSGETIRGFLEVDYALLDDIRLYSADSDGRLLEQRTGDLQPFAERPVEVRNFWFPLTLDAGQHVLLVRVQSSSTLFVPMHLSTVGAGAAIHEARNLWLGMFYGAFMAMLLYNLFLYLSLREPAYFWYLLFGGVVILFSLAFDGTLYRLLPSQTWLQSIAIYLSIFLHCLIALQFSRHFLRTFERFPRLDACMRATMLLLVGCLASGPVLGVQGWGWLSSISVSLISLGLLLVGLYTWGRGQRLSAYYTLAWSALLAASILAALASLGLDLFGIYGSNIIKIGVLIEMLALSLGLADRINLLEEEGSRSRQDAERADLENQAKSRFLARMSHEIRTPLNGVLGTLQLLARTPLDRNQRLYVDTIGGSGDALMKVINDILDYARIEAGNLSLESIDFDLEELLCSTLSLFRAQAAEKNLMLHMSLAPDVPRCIHGDPTRLRQVLTNLLSNGIKFTPQGHVGLEVCLRARPDGTRCLLFVVSDSGIGIDEQAQQQLFHSFAQGDSSTTRRYGGSGLGLAISKELVERMGGGIAVQSSVGEGSRFSFDMPLQAVASEDELSELLKHKTALLCSLDGRALESLGQSLLRWGMRVERCQDPERLQESYESFASPPLLVLMNPWPGSPKAALDRLLAQLESAPRVLLICPENQLATQGLLQSQHTVWMDQPLFISDLRNALGELYRTPGNVAASVPQPQAEQDSSSNPCLLVAEDNPVNQLVVKGFLQRRGYRLRLVTNGREALEEYQRTPHAYQLILMDCEMPEMDGYEATRCIRRFEAEQGLAPLPIVALTAHILAEHRQLGLAAGMNDFLGKPLDCQQLYATLDRYLRAGQDARP